MYYFGALSKRLLIAGVFFDRPQIDNAGAGQLGRTGHHANSVTTSKNAGSVQADPRAPGEK